MRQRIFKARKALILTIIISALGAFFLGGIQANHSLAAAEPLTIKSMTVSVWPEYDDSRILVIYQGEFNTAGDFPSDVTFLAPQSIEIGQVCALQNGTEHLCQLYQTTSENGSLAINYNLPIPTFYLEYYYDGLNGSPDKTFSYNFKSPYQIDELKLEVQQPLQSSNFSLTPPTGSASTDARGFKYYHYSFENVAPDKIITVDASYNKANSKPSVSSSGASAPSGSNSLPVIFGILAAAALVLATWYLISRTRKPARQTVAPARARPMPAKIQAVNQRGSQPVNQRHSQPVNQESHQAIAYCPYCGQKMGPGFRFCPGCGEDMEKHGK